MLYIVISPSTILENYDMEDIMTMMEANSDAQSLGDAAHIPRDQKNNINSVSISSSFPLPLIV